MLIDGDDDVADVGFDGDKGRVNGRLVVDDVDGDDDVADVGFGGDAADVEFDGDKGRVNGRLVVDAGLESSRLTLT